MKTEEENIKYIKIKYDNEKKELSFELNKSERIILDFQESNIDIAIIEIIPKDKIDDSFFLSPFYNFNEDNIKDIDIQVIQYPNGGEISFSEGKITGKLKSYPYTFFHEASTLHGSSGSPIVLKGEEKVIGIHKGSVPGKMKNIGILIEAVINAVNSYMKNGYGFEYYENGDLKYEGNFLDDQYEGEGKLIDDKKQIYIGIFKKGKKNGDFIIVNGENDITKCIFKDDELIEIENSNEGVDRQPSERVKTPIDEMVEIYKSNMPDEDTIGGRLSGFKNILTSKKYWENGWEMLKLGYREFIGNKDFKCECNHERKSHIEIGRNNFRCSECPKNKNICRLNRLDN